MAERPKPYFIDQGNLPRHFPTQKHKAEFWEALGRTVATFGCLEETLGKAIFAFTATRKVPQDEAEAEFEKWLPTLEKALHDPLGGLIDLYGKAVRANPRATPENLDGLLEDLLEASKLRNALCHGSWRPPDDHDRSTALYVDRKMRVFQDAVDVAYLQQVQKHAAELVCAVMDTVTQMGWQFPGSKGPGEPIG